MVLYGILNPIEGQLICIYPNGYGASQLFRFGGNKQHFYAVFHLYKLQWQTRAQPHFR